MAAHRGEVVCSVTTAKALDANMKKEVEGAVKGFLKGNEKALISWSVDANIVGGMVCFKLFWEEIRLPKVPRKCKIFVNVSLVTHNTLKMGFHVRTMKSELIISNFRLFLLETNTAI